MTKNLLIPGVNNYYYEASLNCEIPDIFTDNKNYYWLGGAYYDDYIVIAYISCPYFEVRKLSTKERLGIAYTGTDYINIHANSIWFGVKSDNSSYKLPLLWVSSESEGTIYSFLISDDFTTAELHSKIVLPDTFNEIQLHYINTACSNSEGRILVGGYDYNDYMYDSLTTATYKYYIISDAKCNEVYEYIKNSEKNSTLTLTESDFDAVELDPVLNWKDISYSQGMSLGSSSMFVLAFGNNKDGNGYKNSVHIACKNYNSDNSEKYKSFVINMSDLESVFGFEEMESAIITSLSDSAPFPKLIILQTEVPVDIINTTRLYKLILLDLKEGQPEATEYTIETQGCTSDKSTAKEGEDVTITLPENFPFTDLYDNVFFNNLDIANKDTGKSILTPTSLEFAMPACNIVVSVVYRTFNTKYTITTEMCSANKQSAEKGETITLTATGSGTFSYFTVNGDKINGNTFIMPAKNVICVAVYEQESTKYTITVNGGTSNKTTAEAGETIILTPNNTDNFAYWTVNGVQIEGNTFTMPSENVVCEAVYSESPKPDPDPDPTPDPDPKPTPSDTNKIVPTKEDIVVYGRIVSGSTEGVVADSVLVYDSISNINQHEVNKKFLTGNYVLETSNIKDESITADKLADNSIQTSKLNDSAITSNKLADNSVLVSKISQKVWDKLEDEYLRLDGTNLMLEGLGMGNNNIYDVDSIIGSNRCNISFPKNERALEISGYKKTLLTITDGDTCELNVDKGYISADGFKTNDSDIEGALISNGTIERPLDEEDIDTIFNGVSVENGYVNAYSATLMAIKINDICLEAKNSVLDTKGKPNGLATLDSNGFIPILQLGNLDTQVFLVVTKLPTSLSDIKKNCIYLVPNLDSEEDLNKYKEYVYTGLADTEFELLHWEKLGDASIDIDLTDYITKNDVATTTSNGLMSKEDKAKLDSINDLEKTATDITFTSDDFETEISPDGLSVKPKNSDKTLSLITPYYSATSFVLTSWINHVENAGNITSDYDLIIGNNTPDVYKNLISVTGFDGDGYIKIDSKKSKDSTGNNKNGNMDIVVPNKTGTLCLKRNTNNLYSSTISLSSDDALAGYGTINITQNNDSCVSNALLTGNNVQLTQSEEYSVEGTNYYTGTNVNLSNTLFSINNKKDFQQEKYFYISHSGNLTDSPNKNEDKIQFFTGTTGDSEIPLLIKKEEIKCWGDQIKTTKGKDIRFKTSSSNSVRLTEGEGFKVFANLYAEPDHATDISSFTDNEKNMLKNYSIQNLLLKILKKLDLIDTGNIDY